MSSLADIVKTAAQKEKEKRALNNASHANPKKGDSVLTQATSSSNGAATAGKLSSRPSYSTTNSSRAPRTPDERNKKRSQASYGWFDQSHREEEHGDDDHDQQQPTANTTKPTTGPSPDQKEHTLYSDRSPSPDHEYKGALTPDDFRRGRWVVQRQSTTPSNVNSGSTDSGTAKFKGKQKATDDSDAAAQDTDQTEAPTASSSAKKTPWLEKLGVTSNPNLVLSPAQTNSQSRDPSPTRRPQMKSSSSTNPGQAGWQALRNKLRGAQPPKKQEFAKALTGHELVTELALGTLPMVMVKMSLLDRDEHEEHRIPILMNYLKLRITDSVYPFHDKHAVFRIELQYGDGLLKWVIYRELKDFVNLHAHYRVANFNFRQGLEKVPPFPITSVPYLNWLKAEGRAPSNKAEFSRLQREALETYLLKLVRATMFGPGANRLCKFLEISAMSIALAKRGGELGKQGYLQILSRGAGTRPAPGFHPLQWKSQHEPKWFIVRDSYILAVDDPASTHIYDVFLIDESFQIERPKRLYRQGINKITPNKKQKEKDEGKGEEEDSDQPIARRGAGDPNDPSTTAMAAEVDLRESSQHTFLLKSTERRLRLVAKTERQQDQFIASIERMANKSIWAGKNRFESFAPIRLNSFAQWLIDGRDYFWLLSEALSLAKEKVYIHDWWLSPELYLRRPAATNLKWRLDNLLKRKAEEGVQIFVIVYKEVSNDFTPVDSEYTKHTLRGLHPNIHVQRSPSHTSTGTLFWSHHEKMCVIDETIGFMGGLDLCFGRWDTPGHTLIDDGPKVQHDKDPAELQQDYIETAQIWPGKDYSNQRVLDFHTLDKPDEDMYDRSVVPRQPWHDIGLQLIGQPARDLCRHFVQRWNHLLRTKSHTVKMPMLLPPPDFTPQQLRDLKIMGTCETQICRSISPWSMGVSHVEHSIQNAYIKAIQLSDHFVYIENQFFVTSTELDGTVIENRIGDALVSRIIRAHTEETPWRAIIVIPLIPGYPFPIDHPDAGSVRLIMECQFRSICRGEASIFARLVKAGIDPDEYITFFGLRTWDKLASGSLTTESIYIHAKGMVVDDRIAIIGSANINERSQRGDRDSELACVIRDTDMIDSTMAGKPYKVSRFAHTMRVRLMREHLGIDVDALEAKAAERGDVQRSKAPEGGNAKEMTKQDEWDPDQEQGRGTPHVQEQVGELDWISHTASNAMESAGNAISHASQALGLSVADGGPQGMPDKFVPKGDGDGEDVSHLKDHPASGKMAGIEKRGEGATDQVATLEEKVAKEQRPSKGHQESKGDASEQLVDGHLKPNGTAHAKINGSSEHSSATTSQTNSPKLTGATLTPATSKVESVGGPSKTGTGKSIRQRAYTVATPAPKIEPNMFSDPIADSFYKDVWMAAAVRNTQIFRKVFRCIPDDNVQTWKQYREFQAWLERHNKVPKEAVKTADDSSAPATEAGIASAGGDARTSNASEDPASRARANSSGAPPTHTKSHASEHANGEDEPGCFPPWERKAMEDLLEQVSGTLVLFPTRFLEAESKGGNFLFQKDHLPPLSIYD